MKKIFVLLMLCYSFAFSGYNVTSFLQEYPLMPEKMYHYTTTSTTVGISFSSSVATWYSTNFYEFSVSEDGLTGSVIEYDPTTFSQLYYGTYSGNALRSIHFYKMCPNGTTRDENDKTQCTADCESEIVENTPSEGFIEWALVDFDGGEQVCSDYVDSSEFLVDYELKQGDTCLTKYWCNVENGCSQGMVWSTISNSCEVNSDNGCIPGYNDDEVEGICEPDIECPNPMIYKFTNVDWGIDTRACVPDTSISESQCNADGFVYAKYLDEDPSDDLSSYASIYGDGCITPDYANKIVDDVIWHTLVSGLLPTMGSSTTLLAQDLNRLFTSGKNLWNDINLAFRNSSLDDVKLLTYKPKITEMQMADDGIFYEVEAVAMTSDDVSKITQNEQAYNQYLKDNGYITQTDDLPVGVDNVEFPSVVNDMDDLFYRGSDSSDFTNTMLGTANISKNGKVPDLSVLDSKPLNSQTYTTTSINSNLVTPRIESYPTYVVKTAEKSLVDRVETSYTGYIKYPDGTKTDLAISRVKYLDDGRVIDDVTTTYDVTTTNGVKSFGTNYQSFKDGTGAVTNVINSPSSITTTTTSGTTTTTNQSTNIVTTSTTQNAVDLSPVVEKLNSLDDKLRAIINTTVPTQIAEASLKLDHFNASLDVFDVDFNSYLDFVNGMKDNFNELGTLFDDTKNILENKPVVNEINGQCGFDVVMYGTDFHVDICSYVSPYRPLLALIFTLLGTFAVFGFSVKFLVARGD